MGGPDITHLASHFLTLEHLSRVLTLTGGAKRPVINGNAVRSPEAFEAMTLHTAGKAFALGGSGNVDILPGHKVVSGNFRSDIDQAIGIDTEFNHFAFRLDLSGGKVTAHGLADVLHLSRRDTKLNGVIAILFSGTLGNNLTVIDLQHGDRNMLPVISEDTAHT